MDIYANSLPGTEVLKMESGGHNLPAGFRVNPYLAFKVFKPEEKKTLPL